MAPQCHRKCAAFGSDIHMQRHCAGGLQMKRFAKAFGLTAVLSLLGGAFAVTLPAKAEARESFSFGYSDGRRGLSFGIADGRGRYDRDRRGDRRHYRRYVAPPVYYYPPPRRYAPPPPVYYYYPPPPPPVYYDYRY